MHEKKQALTIDLGGNNCNKTISTWIPTERVMTENILYSKNHGYTMYKKRKEIYRAVAVSAFSMIQFSPKGLTKTDVFIVNFWPLPGFVSIILSVTFACFYNSCCPGILGNPCQIAPEFHSFWYPVCFYNYLATSSKNFRKQLSFAEQLPKTNKQTNNEDQWHKKVRS